MDRVNEVTKEVFNALAQIRRADERAQPMPEMTAKFSLGMPNVGNTFCTAAKMA